MLITKLRKTETLGTMMNENRRASDNQPIANQFIQLQSCSRIQAYMAVFETTFKFTSFNQFSATSSQHSDMYQEIPNY